ncbi:MAG: pyrroline-5-carboxylate reductase [Clostridiales bacterium]|nr:pyrroline-5-carboxylate reductase [Clostridiales bacterium]
MKKKFKLGVIGCGYMGSAIIRGVVLSDFINPKKIVVSDLIENNLDKINELGVFTCNSNKYVAENSEYLLVAVKPQNFNALINSLGDYKPEKIISVMAGIKKQTIKEALGRYTVRVARCMPNLPCSIGSGAMGIDMSDFNGDTDDTDFISNIFNNLGVVLSIDESKIDAVIGISGSGPAYAFMFIDSLIDAGVQQGLSKDEAKILAVQTVLGAAEMVQREEEPLSELIMRVCSKGGTTIEAVKVLEENRFRAIVSGAVAACVKRAKELSE